MLRLITYPADKSEMIGGMDIAHQFVEPFVTIGIPFCDKTGQMAYRTLQVGPCESSRVHDFHKNSRGNWTHDPTTGVTYGR